MDDEFGIIIFSDHTWYFCHKDQVKGFCQLHNWKQDVPKSARFIPNVGPYFTIYLEEE